MEKLLSQCNELTTKIIMDKFMSLKEKYKLPDIQNIEYTLGSHWTKKFLMINIKFVNHKCLFLRKFADFDCTKTPFTVDDRWNEYSSLLVSKKDEARYNYNKEMMGLNYEYPYDYFKNANTDDIKTCYHHYWFPSGVLHCYSKDLSKKDEVNINMNKFTKSIETGLIFDDEMRQQFIDDLENYFVDVGTFLNKYKY